MKFKVERHLGMYVIATFPIGGAIVGSALLVSIFTDDRTDDIAREVNQEMLGLAFYGLVTTDGLVAHVPHSITEVSLSHENTYPSEV